jgi:archaellum component FlaC
MNEDLTPQVPEANDDKLNRVTRSVENLTTLVQNLSTEVMDMKVRLGGLERKVDERLHETCAIWENLTTDVVAFKEEFGDIAKSVTDIAG